MSEKKSGNETHVENYDICGAKAKSTGEPCRKPAGWGTDHPGEGRCKFHGGCNTGPKDNSGNKNAQKHGAYSKVIRDNLDDEELEIYDKVDSDKGLDKELKILRYKLIRLLDPPQREIYDEDRKEKIQLDISESEKNKGTAILVKEIRKIIKQTGGTEREAEVEKYIDALKEKSDEVWD